MTQSRITDFNAFNMRLIPVLVMISTLAFGQIKVPFTSDQWKFETKDYVLEEYQGKQSLLLKNNRAFLRSAEFESGIIEYDVAFPQSRAFIGVHFRMQDEKNYEEFYLRPHQSGNPDANQYSPVFGGLAAWQLYHGEGYGVPFVYTFDTWLHVKLVIAGKNMEVFLNDMEKPVMFCQLKRDVRKGYLGLGDFLGENYFANFSYTPMQNVALKGSPKAALSAAQGTVTQWEVSSPVSEKNIRTTFSLPPDRDRGVTWKKATAESTGTLNLASVATWSEENNTVFARVFVESDNDQVKKFVFGFSDRASVYLNGMLLFVGEDNYRSRDYRYLGTIGYFDAVFLNLKKGRNEILIAVSENTGGWGVKGKFEDVSGIKFGGQ